MKKEQQEDDNDDIEDGEVQKLAAALAPQVQALETLLDDPLFRDSKLTRHVSSQMSRIVSENDDISGIVTSGEMGHPSSNHNTMDRSSSSSSSHHNNNTNPHQMTDDNNDNNDNDDYDLYMMDDDMDQELHQLTYSEDILRREMELATDFASFFGTSPMMSMEDDATAPPPSLNLNLNFDLASLTRTQLFQEEEASPIKLQPPQPPPQSTRMSQEVTSPPTSNNNYAADLNPTFELEEQVPQCEADADDDQDLQEEDEGVTDLNQSVQEIHNTNDMNTISTLEDPRPATSQGGVDRNNESEVPPAINAAVPSPQPPSPPKIKKSDQEKNKDSTNIQDNHHHHSKLMTPTPRKRSFVNTPVETPQTSVLLSKSNDWNYSSAEHFQYLNLRKEPQGAWYSVDLTSHLVHNFVGNEQNSQENNLTSLVGLGMKEYCLSITQWKRLFVGLRLEGDEEEKHQQRKQQQQQQQEEGHQQQNLPRTPPPPSAKTTSTSKAPTTTTTTTRSCEPAVENVTKNVPPARTISIRIRPDVLCGAVMDAVTQTLMNGPSNNASIIKRQGAHLQATVQGRLVGTTTTTTTTTLTFLVDVQLCTQKSSAQCERVLLLRIYHWTDEDSHRAVEDADLWSPSSSNATDMLSPGGYGMEEHPPNNNGDTIDPSGTSLLDSDDGVVDNNDKDHLANVHLREACALIQRIESPELARKMRPLVIKPQSTTTTAPTDDANNTDDIMVRNRALVSEHLLHNYRACPSVLQPDTSITLPALSPQDAPVIQASWTWIHLVWEELETRELTYLSMLGLPACGPISGVADPVSPLPVARFGAFPALPTLDLQYCSQLRRLSREAMIGQLLKSASVLEEYARQAEFQCANLIDLLRPTFVHYKVDAPMLPKPAPLSAYPLEYMPPQTLCPPWGRIVMEALNQVAAMSQEAGQNTDRESATKAAEGTNHNQDTSSEWQESLDLAETAVQMVYEAFQKQDDEEQSARLARKNLQVMDRLEKMQGHTRASINAISVAYTDTAIAAADEFWARTKNALTPATQQPAGQGNTSAPSQPWREVPLLKWTMGVGGSSGTCTITANQLLFTPAKFIPLLSSNRSTWFYLCDVEFSISEGQQTLLNPLSTTINVLERNSGATAYSFKPSSAARRLKSFLDLVQKESV